MPRRIKIIGSAFTLVLLTSAVLAARLFGRRPVSFPSGLTIEWIGTSVGTNSIEYANLAEKLLNKYKLIPPAGLRFGGFTFHRPRTLDAFYMDSDLTGWVAVRGPAPLLPPMAYFWDGSRLVAESRKGRSLENPPLRPFTISSNEVVMALPLYAFPRDESHIRIRIAPPPESTGPATAPKWAQFDVPNPLRHAAEHWTATSLPSTNKTPDLTLVLEQLFMQRNSDSAAKHPSSGSAFSASQSRLVLSADSSDWSLQECRILDDEGNNFIWNRQTRPAPNVFEVGFNYALETNRIWKVETKLVDTAKFPFPMNPISNEDSVELHLVAGGPEVPFKDRFGTTYFCQLQRHELTARKETGLDRPYLLLASATENGGRVPFRPSSGWKGSRFTPKVQIFEAEKAVTNLTVRFFSPRIVTAEFYARPQ